MPTISTISRWGAERGLEEIRTEHRPVLVGARPEYVDGEFDEVFREAKEQLGLGEVEPVYKDGQTRLVAPEGFMFRVTGAFCLWPDGSHLDWSYGPPEESYEQWRLSNRALLEQYEADGLGPEAAEQEVADDADVWNGRPANVPNIEFFHGASLSFSFNGVGWGEVVRAERERRGSSDENPPSVSVRVDGYRKYWRDQAVRHVKLPSSKDDRLLTTHQYGLPGTVPCWEGGYAEGNIEHLRVELVPTDGAEKDEYIPPEARLWLPERVRWLMYEQFPDLIDQNGDYANRTNFGSAMSVLGAIANAFAGHHGNALERLANRSQLMVIDDPMFAHMETSKLAELFEQLVEEHNKKPALSDTRAEEKKVDIEEDRHKLAKSLVVITDIDQSIHQIVREVALDNSWVEKAARYRNFC